MEENLSYNPDDLDKMTAALVEQVVNPAVVSQHEYLMAGNSGPTKEHLSGLDGVLKALKSDGRKVLGFKRDRAGNWSIKVMAPRAS
jgi:hypothetical protein